MSRGIDWCRDVDYGTLPQWLTFGLGVFVGVFTIAGILTARSSYRKSVDDTHVAQARLCYAVLVKAGALHPGQSWDEFGAEPYYVQFAETGGQYEEVEHTDDEGKVIGTSIAQTATVSFVRFKVRNNSDEVIAGVSVRLLLSDGERSDAKFDLGVVDPKSEQECVLVVDEMDPTSLGVLLSFEDSTGATWERLNADPVREVSSRTGGRIARAWRELRTPTES